MWKIPSWRWWAGLMLAVLLKTAQIEGQQATCAPESCRSEIDTLEYEASTEICCGGLIYQKDPLTACCGNAGTMYSTTSQDCCASEEIVDLSTHACCGEVTNSESYDVSTHGCCAGEIFDRSVNACCGDRLHTLIEGSACCGSDLFYSTVETCCNDQVVRGVGECCGSGDVYRPHEDLCCVQQDQRTVFTSSGTDQCCGLERFNPETQLCCIIRVNDRTSPTTGCCGNATFDETTEICCGGHVSPRESNTDCCDKTERPYNRDNQACCHGQIINYAGGAGCCSWRPYNAQRSTCVGDFQVDDYVPDIPGITQMYISNNTAYLSTERFECGEYLHYYRPEENACCGGSITYDTNEQLCCVHDLSVHVVHKRSHSALCCGAGDYNPDEEGCCNSTETYDLATQQCCPDGLVGDIDGDCNDVPQCYQRSGSDEICVVYMNEFFSETRHIPYNSQIAICTPTGVKAIPDGLQTCGDKIYNPEEEICCGRQTSSKFLSDLERRCCEGLFTQLYYPHGETCFNGNIEAVPEAYAELCGAAIFDNRYDGCDNSLNIRRKEEIAEEPDTCFGGAPGPIYYDGRTHSCCMGHLIAANHTCCLESMECCLPGETEGYNTETHMCCEGTLLDKEEGHVCCGNTKYLSGDESKLCCLDRLHDNPTGQLSCSGRTVTGRIDPQTIICRGNTFTDNDIECCGGDKYNTERELCCRNNKYPRTSDQHTCCGSVAFIPGEEGECCGSSLYRNFGGDDACCGNLKYNMEDETCCTTGGNDYIMAVGGQCCSGNGDQWDSSRDTCCDGLIHREIANGQCCGNHVIRDSAREFCCGGQYYHISQGDMKCCNDVLMPAIVPCVSEE